MSGYYLTFLFRPCVRPPIFIHCAVRFMQKNWDKLRKWVNTASMWEAAQFLAGWWVLSPSKVWFVALKSIKKAWKWCVYWKKSNCDVSHKQLSICFWEGCLVFRQSDRPARRPAYRESDDCVVCVTRYLEIEIYLMRVHATNKLLPTHALIDPIFLSVAFYWCDLISLKWPQKPGSW